MKRGTRTDYALIFSSLILVLSKIFSVRVKKSSNSHSLPEIS